jgi:hypothetical protein
MHFDVYVCIVVRFVYVAFNGIRIINVTHCPPTNYLRDWEDCEDGGVCSQLLMLLDSDSCLLWPLRLNSQSVSIGGDDAGSALDSNKIGFSPRTNEIYTILLTRLQPFV